MLSPNCRVATCGDRRNDNHLAPPPNPLPAKFGEGEIVVKYLVFSGLKHAAVEMRPSGASPVRITYVIGGRTDRSALQYAPRRWRHRDRTDRSALLFALRRWRYRGRNKFAAPQSGVPPKTENSTKNRQIYLHNQNYCCNFAHDCEKSKLDFNFILNSIIH